MAGKACLALLVVLIGLSALRGIALGAISDEEELWRTPGAAGGDAGQLRIPFGLGSDPVSGHLYVVEISNNRVSEFTPWGEFVKAFGWDVAPGAVSEEQEVRARAASGQFRLKFGADTTGDLPFNATGAEVEAALNGLGSISGGGGGVSVEAVAGNVNGTTPFVYVVTFKDSLAGTDVAQLVAEDGTTPLEGGDPVTELSARTRADGHAPTAGLEACTAASGCQVGIEGEGAGQFNTPRGVTVDPAGDVYVREAGNLRVQKFDEAGRFVAMFGGEVNKTTGEEICAQADLEGGEVCGAGVPGGGPGEFEGGSSEGITLCPPELSGCPTDGALFVADKERIQRLSLDGVYESELAVPGEAVRGVAFDPVSKGLYATYAGEGVHKLDSASAAELTPPLKGEGPVATDPAGNLFTRFAEDQRVLEYGATGSPLVPPSCCAAAAGLILSALGTNGAADLHVAYFAPGTESLISALGPGPVDFEGPPLAPPQITAQFASSAQGDGATVAAEINPRFFDDTTYHVQYGTGKCSEGGCPLESPVPAARLTTKTSNVPLRAAGVFLEGLTPGTTYHYRFIAESGGGGPVFGIDPDGEGPGEPSEEEGLEETFITPETIAPKACPNDVFRGGFAARLPNCRAYEMVSPLDKNNGDIKALLNVPGYVTSLGQSAADGGRVTYSSYRAFADPKAAPYTNQLLATRGADAWASEALNPPQGSAAVTNPDFNLDNNVKAFSADLCLGWVVVAPEPQLDPPRDAPDYRNAYRRENCGAAKGSYEALIPVAPSIPRMDFTAEPQGSSADGGATVLRANDKLSAEGTSGRWQAYHAAGGELRFLCVLPSGLPSAGNCSAGTGEEASPLLLLLADLGRLANVTNAISTDGSRVYWTDSGIQETGAGKVYLRINPGAPPGAGGACEAGRACTLKVSEPSTSKDARFLAASPDGSRALFEVTEGLAKGDLYEFNLGGSPRLIAGEVLGLAGASDDLSRIYFVSREALAGAASAGEPNLYLGEGGEETFIATLSERDAVIPPVKEERIPSVTARKPLYHAAYASGDGGALAFISNASPTGYDNTDLESGAADSEVYLYEAGAEGPVCVSCDPSRARPVGRVVRLARSDPDTLPMAASLPLATSMLHAPRAISADGSRLFFNSFDALLPRDTNGAADLYMWERAPDKAACAALGAELYVASAAGCLSLISSGESPEDSEFLDASLSGDDAFFITNASLLGQDPGLFDVYDARAGGGLPFPGPPPPDCQGETCKPPATAPSDPTPASSTYEGPGDLNEKKAKKKKAKGKKHKKKKHKKKKGKAKGKARAAR